MKINRLALLLTGAGLAALLTGCGGINSLPTKERPIWVSNTREFNEAVDERYNSSLSEIFGEHLAKAQEAYKNP